MVSPTARISSAAASFPKREDTALKSQTSKTDQKVDDSARPIFEASEKHNPPDLRTLKSKLSEQAKDKCISEIQALVELGQSSGTPEIPRKHVKRLIKDKIESLHKDSVDPVELASVRADLYELTRISSEHYNDLKAETFNLLIDLLEKDPIIKCSAEGVLGLAIKLNNDGVTSKAQTLTLPFQQKLAKAFLSAVELYSRHYNKGDHVPAIVEAQKKEMLDTQGAFGDLNKPNRPELTFLNECAVEASIRLKSDNNPFKEAFERAAIFLSGVGDLTNYNIEGFVSKTRKAVDGLSNKIEKKWFGDLFQLKEMVKNKHDNNKKVKIILTALSPSPEKAKKYDWEFVYGALEILHDVISQVPESDVDTINLAEKGNTPKASHQTTSHTAAAVKIGEAAIGLPKLNGVVFFTNFDKTGFNESKNDIKEKKKEYRAIAKMAWKISHIIGEKRQQLKQKESSGKDKSDRAENRIAKPVHSSASVDSSKMADSKTVSASMQASTKKVGKVASAPAVAITNAEQKEKSESNVKIFASQTKLKGNSPVMAAANKCDNVSAKPEMQKPTSKVASASSAKDEVNEAIKKYAERDIELEKAAHEGKIDKDGLDAHDLAEKEGRDHMLPYLNYLIKNRLKPHPTVSNDSNCSSPLNNEDEEYDPDLKVEKEVLSDVDS